MDSEYGNKGTEAGRICDTLHNKRFQIVCYFGFVLFNRLDFFFQTLSSIVLGPFATNLVQVQLKGFISTHHIYVKRSVPRLCS